MKGYTNSHLLGEKDTLQDNSLRQCYIIVCECLYVYQCIILYTKKKI